MENQHRKIKGYRELSQHEIDAMNKVKELANEIGAFIEELADEEVSTTGFDVHVDPRWLAIAKTDLQKGFMSLTRAIAQPEFF